MRNLLAYDTSARLCHISTLGVMGVPSNLVSTLRRQLGDKNSTIYTNPDPSIKSIMSVLLLLFFESISTTKVLSPKSNVGLKIIVGILVPLSVIEILVLLL